MEEEITKLPSSYKKNDNIGGNIIKKVYFFNNELDFIIFLNNNQEVKYRLGKKKISHCLNELENLSLVDGELMSLPSFFKEDFNLKMAHIYKLALNNKSNNAQKEINILYESIVERKKILKKFVYLITPISLSILLYLPFSIANYFEENITLSSLKLIMEYKSIFIFAGIGNFLSTSKNIQNIVFDSAEMKKSYFIFAFFKYLTSLFSAILLVFLYNSNIVNIKIEGTSEEYVIRLLATLGGFSENIVPNIFEKISQKLEDNT